MRDVREAPTNHKLCSADKDIEIHCQLMDVYGEKCTDVNKLCKWLREFVECIINFDDDGFPLKLRKPVL